MLTSSKASQDPDIPESSCSKLVVLGEKPYALTIGEHAGELMLVIHESHYAGIAECQRKHTDAEIVGSGVVSFSADEIQVTIESLALGKSRSDVSDVFQQAFPSRKITSRIG